MTFYIVSDDLTDPHRGLCNTFSPPKPDEYWGKRKSRWSGPTIGLQRSISNIWLSSRNLTQIRNHRQGKQLAPKQAAGKKQHFKILHLACVRVQPHNNLIFQFLRFLFGIRRNGINAQNIRFTGILKS